MNTPLAEWQTAPACSISNCLWCRSGLAHPAIYLVYDRSKRTYVKEEQYIEARLTTTVEGPVALCSARWASGYREGKLCGKTATHTYGDVGLCHRHARRMDDWLLQGVRAERERFYEEMDRRRRQDHQEALAKREKRLRANQLVYFIERDGLVKIGYTANLDKRIKDISRGSCLIEGMTVGPVRLLATIKGRGKKTEDWMHGRFHHLRVGGEWFLADRELLDFIAGLKGCIASEFRAVADRVGEERHA